MTSTAGRTAKLRRNDATADAAMYQIWKEFHQFYSGHFRAHGIGLSAADQMAFYEIAQPILRSLAAAKTGVRSLSTPRPR